MKLGVGSYAYAWAIGVPGHSPARPLDAFGFLERAAGLGVGLVQICDNLPVDGWTAAEVDRLLGRARELGIELEWGTVGLEPGNLRFYLALVRRCGGGILRLVIDRAGDEPSPEAAVARLRPLLPEFEAAGVRLAIENHDRFRSRTLAWMIEELGVERAGVCLDTVNSFEALEGPEVVVGDLGDVNAIGRKDGFYDAVKGHEEIVEVVSEVPSEWNQEKARSGVVNGLQANPDISFIFTSSDFLFPSIVAALKSANKYHKAGTEAHVILGGFDGDATAYEMLEEGYLDATGVQDVYFEAEKAVAAVVDLLAGKEVPELILDPGFVIHQGNLGEMKDRMWGTKVGKK